jgi:predicted amidohydrolase
MDRGFPADGIMAQGQMDAPGWVFCTLDPTLIEAVRRDGAVLNHRDWPRAPFAKPKPASFA